MLAELQWGHGDEAVEELSATTGQGRNALQWGHGDEAVEEVRHEASNPRVLSGFNGATAMKPWKTRHRLSRIAGTRGFNGATAMKPWKRMFPIGNDIHAASMGPRR